MEYIKHKILICFLAILTSYLLNTLRGHTIDFKKAKEIPPVKNYKVHIIKEALEIETAGQLNKRDDVLNIPTTWKTVIKNQEENTTKINQYARKQHTRIKYITLSRGEEPAKPLVKSEGESAKQNLKFKRGPGLPDLGKFP